MATKIVGLDVSLNMVALMVWSCALSKLIQKWHSPKSESHKLKFLISGTHSLLISRTHSLRGSQEFYPRKFFNF